MILNPDDLTPEQLTEWESANNLRRANAKIVGDCEQMGAHLDMSVPKVESLLMSLVNQGIIPVDAYIKAQVESEQHLAEQLQTVHQQVKERFDYVQAENVRRMRAAAKQLAVPQEKKLIVPGGH